MSLPAARLGAVALAGAILASGLVACSAATPPAVQAVESPTSTSASSATLETSTGIGIGAYRDARGVWWVTQDFVG